MTKGSGRPINILETLDCSTRGLGGRGDGRGHVIDTAGEGTVLDEAANRLQESLAMIHVADAGLRRLEGRLQGKGQLTTETRCRL